jgi:hypothetical protein
MKAKSILFVIAVWTTLLGLILYRAYGGLIKLENTTSNILHGDGLKY